MVVLYTFMLVAQTKVNTLLVHYSLVSTVSHVSLLCWNVPIYIILAVVEHLAKNVKLFSG